jgi:Protein of unknown function (DUF1403)
MIIAMSSCIRRCGGGGHRPGDDDWTRTCCVAYGRAAVAACDLFAELGRSSQKLIAVAPRLRARGAGAVIETLLNEDAVPAAARRRVEDVDARMGDAEMVLRFFAQLRVRQSHRASWPPRQNLLRLRTWDEASPPSCEYLNTQHAHEVWIRS